MVPRLMGSHPECLSGCIGSLYVQHHASKVKILMMKTARRESAKLGRPHPPPPRCSFGGESSAPVDCRSTSSPGTRPALPSLRVFVPLAAGRLNRTLPDLYPSGPKRVDRKQVDETMHVLRI